jgi:predicted Zn-dependent protease
MTEVDTGAVFFDGTTSRRHPVTLALADTLQINAGAAHLAGWAWADIRRADAPEGVLRLRLAGGSPLARLDIRDAALAAGVLARCPHAEAAAAQPLLPIVGWSLGAVASLLLVVFLGLPLLADRLAPLVPPAFERRLGDVAAQQAALLFDGGGCGGAAGVAALRRLVTSVAGAIALEGPLETRVINNETANAFALPGGRIVVLRGLIDEARSPDEIAGVLAHELGHLQHRDSLRHLIHAGGASFLVGLLFGDFTGASGLIVASRTLIDASYSREVETAADDVTIAAMHKLGRPPQAMGELLLRVTGRQRGEPFTILAGHPLSEDRLARMRAAARPVTGEDLLTPGEWSALKAICR